MTFLLFNSFSSSGGTNSSTGGKCTRIKGEEGDGRVVRKYVGGLWNVSLWNMQFIKYNVIQSI